MSEMRLIDANALHNVFDAMHAIPGGSHFDHLVLLGIKKYIDDAPTIDVAPVVRCRACMHWQRDWECTSGKPGSHYCSMIDLVTKPDFYCKSGEEMHGGAEG